MRDAGRGDDVVDARVVIAAGDEDIVPRRQQRGEDTVFRRLRSTALVVRREHLAHRGAELERGRGRTTGRVDVHAGAHTEHRAMQHIGDGVLDAFARVRGRLDGAEDAGDAERVVQALQVEPDDRIELPGRKRRRREPGVDPRDDLVTGARRDRGEDLVALVRVEDRLVARVDLGVARNPRAHRDPARRGRG